MIANPEPTNLAPHSKEAEEAVLAAMIINPDCIPDVAAQLKASDFFIVRNDWVFKAILAVDSRRDSVDSLTITQELRDQGVLDQVGGSSYLAYLLNSLPTHQHTDTYADLVRRAAIRRRMLEAASQIATLAMQAEITTDDLVARAVNLVEATDNQLSEERTVTAREAAANYYSHVEKMYNREARLLGIPTGLTDLDRLTSGAQNGQLTIVGARPSVGKSALLIQSALHASLQGIPFLFCSMEMNVDTVINRMVAQLVNLDSRKMQSGKLGEADWTTFMDGITQVSNLPFVVDDSSTLTVASLRRKAKRAVRRDGCRIVFVDYLQLMTGVGKQENRTQEIGSISRGLKELAMELNVPVYAAVQVSRASEMRADKHPQLSDLRESGSIEADADVVILLHRPDMYKPEDRANQVDMDVKKNRHGPRGMITCYYKSETTRFTDMVKETLDLKTAWGGNPYQGKDE